MPVCPKNGKNMSYANSVSDWHSNTNTEHLASNKCFTYLFFPWKPTGSINLNIKMQFSPYELCVFTTFMRENHRLNDLEAVYTIGRHKARKIKIDFLFLMLHVIFVHRQKADAVLKYRFTPGMRIVCCLQANLGEQTNFYNQNFVVLLQLMFP